LVGRTGLEASYGHQRGLDMIPILMEKKYRPDGWVGLLLGTRLWYDFHGCENEDDIAFEKRVDGLVREIADRGKAGARVSEGVPPAPAPAPAPTPALAASTAALAPAPSAQHQPTAPAQSSPMLQVMAPAQPQQPVGSNLSMVEVSQFVTEQLKQHWVEQRQHDEKMQGIFESKLAEQKDEMKQQMQQQRADIESKLEAKMPRAAISDEQLTTLQARIEALLASRLLEDADAFVLQDLCADYIEEKASSGLSADGVGMLTREMIYGSSGDACVAAMQVHKLMSLSESMPSDVAFARQARRKFSA
jgi:hypothetical protein